MDYPNYRINEGTQERYQKIKLRKKRHFPYYISSTKNSSKDRISDSAQKRY